MNQAVSERLGDGFRLGVHLQFFVDVAHVKLHGVNAERHLVGSRFVVVSFSEKLQQPLLLRA